MAPPMKWNPEKFLELLESEKFVFKVCEMLGIEKSTPYRHKAKDPDFAKKFESIMEDRKSFIRQELEERALYDGIYGWDEPVFYQGVKVATQHKFSVTMRIFLLKCWIPKKYNIDNIREEDAAKIAVKIRQHMQRLENRMPKRVVN